MGKPRKSTGSARGVSGELRLGAGLWLLAVVVRLLFLYGTTDRAFPFSIFYYGDSRAYREFALAILAGESYDAGIPFHAPLFAWVLAGLIDVAGVRPTLIRALLGMVAALAVPLTYSLGLRLFSRAAALVAALLATFSFALCVTAVSANSETLFVPLLVAQTLAVVLLADRLADKGGRAEIGLALLAGALAGLGALTRPEHLAFLLLVPLALLLAAPGAEGWRLLRVLASVLVAGVLVIAPTTWSNHVSLARFNQDNPLLSEPLPTFVPVSNYGPINFALANSPDSRGTFDPRPLVGDRGWRIDLRDPRHLDLYLHGYRRGLGTMAADPWRALRLWARKLALAAEAQALGFGLSDWPGGLRGVRRPVDLFVPDRKWLLPLSLLLLAAGLWEARLRWRPGAVVGLAILHKALVCAAFFGYVRLFVHLAPFVFLLQAHALVTWSGRMPGQRWRRALAAGGIALAVLLLVELGLATARPRNFVVSGSSNADGTIVQDAELRISPAH